MAHTNISTGEIAGCEPGSLTWWHEKGHLVYNSEYWGQRLALARQNFQDLAIVFLAVALFFASWKYAAYVRLGAFSAVIGWTFVYFFEELWAWGYAFKHYKDPIEL